MPTACSPAVEVPRQSVWPYVVIAIYGLLLLLPFLDYGAVLSRHEVLAAEPAREMLAGAPWSIQTFAGELRTAKQPTMSWLIAGSMKLLHSQSTFACRLPSALAGIITAIAIASIGTHLISRRTGFLAGLITLTCYWVQMQSRLSEADMPLTAAVTVAMGIVVWSLFSGRSLTFFSPLFYAAVGAAFMLKAPGMLVPMMATIAFAFRTHNGRLKAMLRHPAGLAVFAIFVLVWPALVLTQHHEMLQVWWREIGERSAGRFGHEQKTTPLIYLIDLPFYLWWTPILMLPATPVLIAGIILARRQWNAVLWRFVASWVLPWLLLLTLLPLAKAKHYFLPALPPLSLLAAWGTEAWMAAFKTRRQSIGWTAAWFVVCLAVILYVQARILPKFGEYNGSASLGKRATAMLPPGEQAVMIDLEEAHIAFYLDPIPKRIDDPTKVPTDRTLYAVCSKATLEGLHRTSTLLADEESLHRGDKEEDRLVFIRLDPK